MPKFLTAVAILGLFTAPAVYANSSGNTLHDYRCHSCGGADEDGGNPNYLGCEFAQLKNASVQIHGDGSLNFFNGPLGSERYYSDISGKLFPKYPSVDHGAFDLAEGTFEIGHGGSRLPDSRYAALLVSLQKGSMHQELKFGSTLIFDLLDPRIESKIDELRCTYKANELFGE